VISSRTPEGDAGRCAICGHDCRLDPSWPGRDAPCPSCGHLLWFAESCQAAREGSESPLLEIARMRFGPLPADAREAVEELASRGDVAKLFERALTASSWGEFISTG
jgi:hypothetical protein